MINKYGTGVVAEIWTESKLVCHVAFGRVIWSGTFYTYILPRFSHAVASEINKLWASSFFWKYSKLNLHFENTLKNPEKVFSFWDNCMWMGSIKLSLLGREHMSTAFILLRNSLKLSHITKRDFLPLNSLPIAQQICCTFSRSDLNRVETHLPCSFWEGNLKRDFLHICLTTFFAAVASEINKLWGHLFFENVQNLTQISKMHEKIEKKL